MALESATFLDDLVTTNPAAGDQVSQGDDHIRMLKSVLKATFPGLTAAVNISQSSTPQFAGVSIGASGVNVAINGVIQHGTFSAVGATNGTQISGSGSLLESSRTVDGAHQRFCTTSGVAGTITTAGPVTAYNTASDARDKVDLGRELGAVALLKALPVHRTRFKVEPEGLERPMFFAQEVAQILPHAASTDPETGKMFVSYGDCVPTLWAALQDALARIEALEAR